MKLFLLKNKILYKKENHLRNLINPHLPNPLIKKKWISLNLTDIINKCLHNKVVIKNFKQNIVVIKKCLQKKNNHIGIYLHNKKMNLHKLINRKMILHKAK